MSTDKLLQSLTAALDHVDSRGVKDKGSLLNDEVEIDDRRTRSIASLFTSFSFNCSNPALPRQQNAQQVELNRLTPPESCGAVLIRFLRLDSRTAQQTQSRLE